MSSSEWRKVVTYFVLELMSNQRTDKVEASQGKKEGKQRGQMVNKVTMSPRIIKKVCLAAVETIPI